MTAKTKAAKKTAKTKAAASAGTAVGIHGRAMLVSLKISAWRARRFDERVTKKVNADHGAASDAGRYHKHVLGGSDVKSFNAIVAAQSAVRKFHYEHTLPWSNDGQRLLPTAEYWLYTDGLRALKAQFEEKLETFLAEYPQIQKEAKKRLNGMYRKEDYPTVDELRSKFEISFVPAPLPSAGDFRLDLPAEQMREIEAAVEARLQEATEAAMHDLWNRLYEAVDRIRERLADPKAIFRDSLIETARELVGALGRMNITEDKNLEAMRKRVEKELTKHEPDSLRKDEELRAETAKAAEQILDRMLDIYGGPQA